MRPRYSSGVSAPRSRVPAAAPWSRRHTGTKELWKNSVSPVLNVLFEVQLL